MSTKTVSLSAAPGRTLDTINRALAATLHTAPARLTVGAAATLADTLVLCGVLGGKNVGKSTLINALARRRVTRTGRDDDVRGTDRPVAYVHADAREQAALRLRGYGGDRETEWVVHDADEIRNLVLVDLPDFDSAFLDHVRTVRSMAPVLDRIIWVMTPRKLGDRAWIEMASDVIKDARNVYGVLNKADELLTDADPFEQDVGTRETNATAVQVRRDAAIRFRRRYDAWLAEIGRGAGCALAASHRFLIAAAFPRVEAFVDHIARLWDDPQWVRYGHDREAVTEVGRLLTADLDRLRNTVLAPLSDEEVRSIKQANQNCEASVNAERIRRHYELERTLETLGGLCDADYAASVLQESFDDDARLGLVNEAVGAMRSERALADELLERRVETWPLLRLVHWPLGWLARLLGRRVAPAAQHVAVERFSQPITDAPHLRTRIELLRSRVLADAGPAAERLDLERDMPSVDRIAAELERAMHGLPNVCEEMLIEEIRSRDRRPSLMGRALLWFVLLWFPFLQPLAEGGLQMYLAPGAFSLARGAYVVVSALSAPQLLAGLAVVAGVYVAVLAGMFLRSVRAVRRSLAEGRHIARLDRLVNDALMDHVWNPLIAPIAARYARLAELADQLDHLAARTTPPTDP